MFCTRFYAMQRGRRMARRALRDGKPLDYRTYQEYGEWAPSAHLKEAGQSNLDRKLSYSPDLINEILRCPWHIQFCEMGCKEAGRAYCAHLDDSIAQGFSNEIFYEVKQTLHDHDSCIHIIHDARYEQGESHPRKEEFVRPFSYHCAHLFFSFQKNISIILQDEDIGNKVLDALERDYGKQMRDLLMTYENVDFEEID